MIIGNRLSWEGDISRCKLSETHLKFKPLTKKCKICLKEKLSKPNVTQLNSTQSNSKLRLDIKGVE